MKRIVFFIVNEGIIEGVDEENGFGSLCAK
jgi:hypothetical protein